MLKKILANPVLKIKTATVNVTTTPGASQTSAREEVTAEEITAIEAVLRHIDQAHQKQKLFVFIAQWFLLLKMFKEFELSFTVKVEREATKSKHRAILTSVMGFGEVVLDRISEIHEKDLKSAGWTRGMIEANVLYLREKYGLWYSQNGDPDEVERVSKAIDAARA